ncbi:MAG: response regulator transcription factor [Steroidobacteraceae bacterium]
MNERKQIRVLCVDDHPLFLQGVATIIAHQVDMALVGTASSGADALVQYRQSRPDVTLMDLRLPDLDGISAMVAIRSEFADARVMMLTTFEGDVEIQRALSAGARGYMLKTSPPAALLAGIRTVHAGRKHIPVEIASNLAQSLGSESLSEREIEVLRELAEGHRNRDIGVHLSISEETVKGHVRSILDKLGAKDRTQAVSIGVRRGIIYL